MANNTDNNQQPPKKRSLSWLLYLVGAIAVFWIIMWSMGGCSVNTPKGSYDRFTQDIGLTNSTSPYEFGYQKELDDSNPPVEIETNRIPANKIEFVIQQGSDFYVLYTPSTGDSAGLVNQFKADPKSYATYYFSWPYTNVFEIIDAYNEWVGKKADELLAAAGDDETEIEFATNFAQNYSISRDYAYPASSWFNIGTVVNILFLILLGVVVFMIFRSMSNRSGLGNMGRNRATHTMGGTIRFADVAGIDEEKEEVQEIVQFLKNPRKFLDLGARIPKGVLLVGQPGTGKTLLAKAIAGEAGVHFFSISGSDFSEMLVGVGPSRMRDLFETAKLNAPAIIFIDEIDSIARMRGVGVSGVSDENEQTLNQLLVQMDGFTKSEGVIVIAATNRPDVLDQALLRPGRFDRQIIVQMPDVKGREQILKVHAKQKPLGSDINLKRVAQIISGFSGADIENLLNESAIIAAKKDKKKINMTDIQEGINKVLLGPQKRSRIITDQDKKITAYHEAGHAIVSRILQPDHVVQEVSIIPRGMAAGYTLTNDDDESHHKSKKLLNSQLAMLMAGRVAESLFIGDICTGSSNDLKVATGLAERMVTMFGMSEKLGPLYYGKEDEMALRLYNAQNPHSESLQSTIDNEITAIILAAEKSATEILKSKKAIAEVMSQVLLERETIYADDIALIMAGKPAKDVMAEMEKRDIQSREQEQKDKTDAELELLEHDLEYIMQMAQKYVDAKLAEPAKLDELKKNMELAREVIRSGKELKHLPTLDNLDTYATLIENTPEPKEEKPKEKTKTVKTEKKNK